MAEMQDFLRFRKMVTPLIIEIIFWVSLVACVIGCFVNISQGKVLDGILTLILGPIVVRIYCELLIVVFKMLEALNDIRNKCQSQQPPVL